MAEVESKWALNIDKIAYGIAGVVALVILALPFVAGGQDQSNSLALAEESLKKAVDEHVGKLRPKEYKNLEVEIARHWSAGTASDANPMWLTERSPVFTQLIEKPLNFDAIHEPPELLQVSCERDPATKRCVVVIQGKPSAKNEYVQVRKMEVLRKEEGVEGDGKVLGSMDLTKDPLEIRDEAVEAGKVYSYALRSTAIRDPRQGDNVQFDVAVSGVKTSDFVPVPAIPHEYSLVFGRFTEQKFFGKLVYFDYKANKVVETRGLTPFSEGERFANGRFELFRVDDAKQVVTVRDTVTLAKEELKSGAKDHRPVAAWEPQGRAAPAPEAPPAEDDPAAETAPKGKAKGVPAKGKAAAPGNAAGRKPKDQGDGDAGKAAEPAPKDSPPTKGAKSPSKKKVIK